MTLRCTLQLRGWAEFTFPEQASPRGCWVCTDLKLPRPRVTFPRIVYSCDGTPTGVHWRCELHGFQRKPPGIWTHASTDIMADLQTLVERFRTDT